jgi:hypothetical protein
MGWDLHTKAGGRRCVGWRAGPGDTPNDLASIRALCPGSLVGGLISHNAMRRWNALSLLTLRMD